MRISVDGRRIRNNEVAFSNLSGIVWTGPKSAMLDRVSLVQKEPIMLRIKIATFLKIDFKNYHGYRPMYERCLLLGLFSLGMRYHNNFFAILKLYF